MFEPASWQLTLTSAARRLVVLFIVLGSLFLVGYAVLVSALVSQAGNISAADAQYKLNVSYDTLTGNLDKWQDTVRACDKNLTCVTKADGRAATYFSAFASRLQGTPMPSGASAAASRLYSDATRAAQDFAQLSRTTTVVQYQNTFTDTGLQQTLHRFDHDFNALGTVLLNS